MSKKYILLVILIVFNSRVGFQKHPTSDYQP